MNIITLFFYFSNNIILQNSKILKEKTPVAKAKKFFKNDKNLQESKSIGIVPLK